MEDEKISHLAAAGYVDECNVWMYEIQAKVQYRFFVKKMTYLFICVWINNTVLDNSAVSVPIEFLRF